MGLLGKIATVISCAIGVVCCCFALGQNKYVFMNADSIGSSLKAYIGCTFIALFIFMGAAILIFLTFCCPCTDILAGIVGIVCGAASFFFLAVAYTTFNDGLRIGEGSVPMIGEWLFGGIVSTSGVILVSITLIDI